LLEFSVVPVPMNQHAVGRMASMPEVRKALELSRAPVDGHSGVRCAGRRGAEAVPVGACLSSARPGRVRCDSFRRTEREHEGKPYSVIMGKLQDGDGTMVEQTYRYPKDSWSVEDASNHCATMMGVSRRCRGGGRPAERGWLWLCARSELASIARTLRDVSIEECPTCETEAAYSRRLGEFVHMRALETGAVPRWACSHTVRAHAALDPPAARMGALYGMVSGSAEKKLRQIRVQGRLCPLRPSRQTQHWPRLLPLALLINHRPAWMHSPHSAATPEGSLWRGS